MALASNGERFTSTVRVTDIYEHKAKTGGKTRWEVWTKHDGFPRDLVFDVWKELHAAAFERAKATNCQLAVEWHDTRTYRQVDNVRFVEV